MPTCGQNDVISASKSWILNVCISVLNLWPFKKIACQYLYFKISLYISQSPKCRQNDVILASRCRQIDFSILVCISVSNLWSFKKNACQYFYFKISLYISQSPTCRQNDVILASRCQQIDFSMLHLYISF